VLELRKQMVLSKIKELVARAEATYDIKLPLLDIRFDLKGRAAGMAVQRGGQYAMRFNATMMLNEAWDHIINNTVPHELAHIICMYAPRYGKGHDSGWKRVCASLGGNARGATMRSPSPAERSVDTPMWQPVARPSR
jgi:predicted SprT family Zn-dependent metalloprotease